MCHHHRSRCGYGHHGYGHHRSGPISTLVALAIPLLTQQNSEKQTVTHSPRQTYQTYQLAQDTQEHLAPQTTGRTAAPIDANESRGPPPAYQDEQAPFPNAELEKDMSGMRITEPAAATAAAATDDVEARDYQPLSRTQQAAQAPVASPREIVTAILDPGSRWAARLRRKEDKARAKLARKAEKYARRERRDMERGY